MHQKEVIVPVVAGFHMGGEMFGQLNQPQDLQPGVLYCVGYMFVGTYVSILHCIIFIDSC